MKEITSHISDPIIPNVGLGGFLLRTPLKDLHRFLMDIYIERKGDSSWCSAESIFDIAYDLAPMLLVVNAHNGKVGSIIARSGYCGTVFGRISVGMLIGDAMAIDDRLYYDEALEKVFVRDCPGVRFGTLTMIRRQSWCHRWRSWPSRYTFQRNSSAEASLGVGRCTGGSDRDG